jgi:hypothetical protein
MPIYSEKTLREFEVARLGIHNRYATLLFAYLNRSYSNELARNMALQGFCRRLKTLVYCTNTAFETIPPDSGAIPGDQKLQECIVAVQAFVFNVFGCLDNLAHVWVRERGITRASGKPIPPLSIGLGEKCTAVRASLSQDFQEYLSSEETKSWFAYQEGYRHALAHRVPLYIPSHGVKKSQAENYQELERMKQQAIIRMDMDEHDRLDREQMKLCVFQPFITHAWDEQAPILYFHGQMIADYGTVIEMGHRMLKELDRPISVP